MKGSSRKSKFLATFLILAIVITGLTTTGVKPAHAAVVHTVNVDAASLSPTDVIVTSSASDAKSFRVGAVVNASTANTISNLDGWQFSINYNASAFVPQGDPSAASAYPDGAANALLFGAQTTTGTANWAGLVASNKAFGSSTTNAFGSNGTLTVFLTILAPNPTVTLSANNLLANVGFELLNKPSTPQLFRITNVIFVDSNGALIAGVLAGNGATETITNNPPIARFTATPHPQLGPADEILNATASSDSDGTIASPSGYFWDFGDGTQDLGVTGAIVDHNFTSPGLYNVTLRVADNLGATASARDGLGNIIMNSQPSHTFLRVQVGTVVNQPPVAIFTFAPANPAAGQSILFDGRASFDPDGTVVAWFWSFGDSTTGTGSTISHTYSTSLTYNVTLIVQDNGNATGTTNHPVQVGPAASSLVAVNMNPGSPTIQNSTVTSKAFTVDVEAVNVVDLFGWQFTVNYNSTALQTSNASITLGPFWQNALYAGTGFLVTKTASNGMITVAFTLLDGTPTFNGTSVLATISFNPTQSGLFRLHLTNTILIARIGGTAQPIPITTQDGFVTVLQVDELPVAQFTFVPTTPFVGDTVSFDGSASRDPDGSIFNYLWLFGDGSSTYGPSNVYHTYTFPGNYTVTLMVTDSSGLTGSVSHAVIVQAKPPHDVAVVAVSAYPAVAISSTFVGIQVVVLNTGMLNDTVSVIVYANSAAVGSVNGVFIQAPPPGCINCFFYTYVIVPWDTTGVAAGNYTISATVFLAADPTPADNSMTDGTVTILPAPTLTVTPSSGPQGTKVLVQGTGFPGPRQGIQLGQVDVSFDDMILGFAVSKNGAFNFTLDVPLSQPGPHLIKAFDVYFGTRSSVAFTVTATAATGGLAVSVNVGTVYFPGDKVAIYVLATLNGAPVNPASTTVTAVIINPDGTTTNLVLVAQTNGLYKATLSLSTSKALIGTYAILAKAHMAGPLDATSVTTFEVRLPWMSSGGGQATITTAAVVGVAGMLGVLWKKGYIRRRDDASPLPF